MKYAHVISFTLVAAILSACDGAVQTTSSTSNNAVRSSAIPSASASSLNQSLSSVAPSSLSSSSNLNSSSSAVPSSAISSSEQSSSQSSKSEMPNSATTSSSSAAAVGCPLTQEGFSMVSAGGQLGTTGGAGSEVVTVGSQEDLNRYATDPSPYVIRVEGAIKFVPKGTEIRVASHKTIIGVGTSGEIVEGGFRLNEGVRNVIIRNLTIRDSFVEGDWDGKDNDFDGVQMDNARHIWIDHNHFTRGGDGLIDSRKDTSYLTVSWNIFSDHNKTFGIGWTDNVTAQMTIHHNWIRDTSQRNPAVDNVLRAHLYNNWLQRIDSYGNHARGGTNMVLENSVFEDMNKPHFYDTGTLVAIGNSYKNTRGDQRQTGSAYSFFNPRDFYDYTLHSTSEVKVLLTRCAGPQPTLGTD